MTTSYVFHRRSLALENFPLTCDETKVRLDMERLESLEPMSYVEIEKNKPLRHAVVNILGSRESKLLDSLEELRNNFDSLDRFLLSPAKFTYIFLYDFTDMLQASKELETFFRDELKWNRSLQPFGKRTENLLVADGEWLSTRGTRILVKGRLFELPLYIQREPEVLQDPLWLGCNGHRRSVSYNLYSGAVFSHHIFSEPLLDEFDYVFKVDLDIQFLKLIPFPPSLLMRNKDCLFLHSSIDNGKSNCNQGVVEAAKAFSNIIRMSSNSFGFEWCDVPHYFSGNFVGYNMAFLSSPKQQYFSRWLYECVKDGYFRYRWGDQAPYPIYLCLWRHIPDIKNSSDICSIHSWRDDIFQHT